MKLNFLSFAAATMSLSFASGSLRKNNEKRQHNHGPDKGYVDAHHGTARHGTRHDDNPEGRNNEKRQHNHGPHKGYVDAPYGTAQHFTNYDDNPEGRIFGLCDNLVHPIKNHHNEASTCKGGSSPTANKITVTTYNVFMLWCFGPAPCEDEERRKARAPRLPLFFENRNDDIVFFQEMFSNNDVIKKGMLEAGFCGQAVSSDEAYGSGLGIFTKFKILETKFIDWCDSVCGDAPACLSVEAITDKGVLYAKIEHTDGTIIHAFNAHTESDSISNSHEVRAGQFERMEVFIDGLNIPADEAVFMGGDLNEDYWCSAKYKSDCPDKIKPFCKDHEYFNRMLGILDAGTARMEDIGNDLYSYNSVQNQLLADKYKKFGDGKCMEHYQTLDYVLFSKAHKKPNLKKSSCHVEHAVDPTSGYDLSDHLPVSCNYDFSPKETTQVPIYVTIESIKCIEREDNSWWQDDEISVVINNEQVSPGPNPSRDYYTFDSGTKKNLSSHDKMKLKRNIYESPVYCLRELDSWNNHEDIGCFAVNPNELKFPWHGLPPSKTILWDRTLENDEGKYEVVFVFSY